MTRRLTPPAAVVFDMDGLLLDTERLARECFEEACRVAGVEVPAEVYARCIGSNQAATAAILSEALDSETHYRRLERAWDELYHARIRAAPIPVKAGAVALLDALAAQGVPLGLATSTSRPTATFKLERARLLNYFSCLICGGETARGKPYPDPYLAAVTGLGIPAASAWALEDSANGVRAARAAGLRVFQVPDLVAPDDSLRGLGHHVADDLFEVLETFRATLTSR